ncbi:MAG: ferritin family protein [Candidatus Heimdallarchaeota archaeon]
MELGTFGVVFAFAIYLEEKSAKFYEEVTSILESPEARNLLTLLGTEVKKRKKKLGKTRQEFIRESILVHVTGLKRSNYEVKVGLLQDIGDQQLLKKALELEENSYQFYKDAATKIGVPDVKRTFKRLAKENSDRQLQIRTLQRQLRGFNRGRIE